MVNRTKLSLYKKKKIPTALRNQVWLHHFGEQFHLKCPTAWCTNSITPFSFEAGHNIPESHGGPTILSNLIPICGSCNKSMGNTYSFNEWSTKYSSVKTEKQKTQQKTGKKSWWLFC
jgi:5-methylcytosine-specific restriction endonuclease McrA